MAINWGHCRHRRISRRSLSRRQGAEDTPVSDWQQLRWHRHSVATKPFLRRHHRYLHHSAEKSKKENKTLFIDASQLFIHEGNKNKLSPENIEAIVAEYAKSRVATCNDRNKHFSALVDNATIAENGYNLSVSSYVEAEDTRPQTDIKELNARIARIVEHENRLRAEIDAIIKELEA